MATEHPLFRATEVKSIASETLIYRHQSMLWMGSCFVESMVPFLAGFRYQFVSNPFGVVFNPLVISQLLVKNADEICRANFEKEGVWMNFWLGSPFYAQTGLELGEQIRKAKEIAQNQLENADWLVLTWGTAFWYEHHQAGMVGKCHKLPQALFVKRKHSVDEIVSGYQTLIQDLRKANPMLKILLTVSPVRHTRDGLEANALSKSTLRLAVDSLQNSLPDVFYFPAYEIMLDELRDYRFYESDLVHPNQQAITYIWEQFEKQHFTSEEIEINQLMKRIQIQKQHRPLAPFGVQFEKWQADLDRKEQELALRLEATIQPIR